VALVAVKCGNHKSSKIVSSFRTKGDHPTSFVLPTERASTGLDDVSFVRSFVATFFLPAVGRAFEEVRSWVLTRSIDIIVLRIIAHVVEWLAPRLRRTG
jgi:hypothetical protein